MGNIQEAASLDPVRILIVDDEEDICWAVSGAVRKQGWQPIMATSGEEALASIQQAQPDVVLLDLQLPDIQGEAVIRKINALYPDIVIIVITGYGSTQDAVRMVKSGIYDYLTKPFDHDQIIITMQHALEERKLKQEIKRLRRKAGDTTTALRETMGSSKAVQLLIAQVARVAQTDFTVLITGETGAGKDLVAQAIHASSHRANKPFIAVDCGAIPEALMERELFGHEKGAFTGADRAVPGAAELASCGTLFLDEIGNLPLSMQSKLLRVLEDRRIQRLGGTKSVKADFRVIAATNAGLSEQVERQLFRRDLYHRLTEFTVHVPPLRERREDLPFLVRRILALTNEELGKSVRGLSASAWESLQTYDWPGNVRELRNVLRRGVLLADEGAIDRTHLWSAEQDLDPFDFAPPGEDHLCLHHERCLYKLAFDCTGPKHWNLPLKDAVQQVVSQMERMVLNRVLAETKGNKAEAARLLKIDYKTIHTKLKEYGISNGIPSEVEPPRNGMHS
ncbi:MAG: sigma-54 dependent transcriptional regulator [Burkholderiales bacterium]|nr:sigma-54 dependent transcriptional regulator [Burkholderiales bacterium]